MGIAILVLLIGIPLGLLMLFKPRQMWWATESWKYKHPDANEPSEAQYGFNALGGAVTILVAIGLAAMAWSTADDQKKAADKQQKEEQWEQEVAAYKPPPPENRGRLPIIGYVERPQGKSYEMYFLQPNGASSVGLKTFTGDTRRGWYQCVTSVGAVGPADGGPRAVHASLSWAPDVPQLDDDASRACSTDNLAADGEIKSETIYGDAPAGFKTDSSIVDVWGTVLTPAGPANPIPKLAGAPHR